MLTRKLLMGAALTVILASLLSVAWWMGASSAAQSPLVASAQTDVGVTAQGNADQGGVLDFSQNLNPAMNSPDRFSWEIFATIVRPAINGSNDALFETWATDPDTFPDEPRPSECGSDSSSSDHCPVWPGSEFRPDTRVSITLQTLSSGQNLPVTDTPTIETPSEVVYRNRATFDYIVNNELWYVEGLQAAVQLARVTQRTDAPFVIRFPTNAIEVKSDWIEITEDQKEDFHWNLNDEGTLFGLVALHVMTKQIPNWTWATWEHVDNPARCDIIGCIDHFGQVPPMNPPAADVGGDVYPPEPLTPALEALFSAAGLPDQWKNYRLKGSQMTFTDSIGRSLLLGNSVAERGFVTTASCMTCHARAAIDDTGDFLAVFEVIPASSTGALPSTQFNPQVIIPEQASDTFDNTGSGHVSANGVPNLLWYIGPNTLNSANSGALNFLQLDFVWGFVMAKNRVDD